MSAAPTLDAPRCAREGCGRTRPDHICGTDGQLYCWPVGKSAFATFVSPVPAGEPRIEGGSRVVDVGPVRLMCMAPDARDLLDVAIEKWRESLALRERNGIPMPEDDAYSFAYWFLRHSGLVVVESAAPVSPSATPRAPDTLDALPDYEAALAAFVNTTAYWAPEMLSSHAHVAKLVEAIADAACESLLRELAERREAMTKIRAMRIYSGQWLDASDVFEILDEADRASRSPSTETSNAE